MKKPIFIILSIYLVAAISLLLIFDDQEIESFTVLSIKKNYSRILTPNEVIDVPIYISENKTFFTEKSNIIDARLTNIDQEMDLDISEIRDANMSVQYNDETYYKYYLSLDFSNQYIYDLYFNVNEAKLNITYNNDANFEISIGHLHILFHDLEQNNFIDFKRMYSLHDQINDGQDQVFDGIYVELINQSSERIKITRIDTLNSDLHVDLKEIIEVDYPPEINQGPIYFNESYDYISNDFENDSSFILNQSKKLILPLKHLHQKQVLTRFPLIIHYEYLGQSYRMLIDDFKFMSYERDFLIYENTVETYHYQYS